MAAIYSELHVAGHVLPLLRFTYGVGQPTDQRGRASAKVSHTLVELTASVPESHFLLEWASNPYQRLPAQLVVLAAGRTLESYSAAAYCVGYRESFESGDVHLGSYSCHVTLAAPDGWHWQPGSLSVALVNPPPLVPLPPPAPVLPELAATAVEEPAWTRLALSILRVLEAGTSFPLLLAACLLLPQTAHAPGIPQYAPDKDDLRLAELEHLHQLGRLTQPQQAEYLVLLAKVRGIYLDALDEHLREVQLKSIVPDFEEVNLAGLRDECVGEFDGINMKGKIFIENKSAEGLTRVNPRTGLPYQSAAEWAQKHIYAKTIKRIKGLASAKYTYPPPAPDIEQIRHFRRLHFRIDADTPAVRTATEKAMNQLRADRPEWEFSAHYGNN